MRWIPFPFALVMAACTGPSAPFDDRLVHAVPKLEIDDPNDDSFQIARNENSFEMRDNLIQSEPDTTFGAHLTEGADPEYKFVLAMKGKIDYCEYRGTSLWPRLNLTMFNEQGIRTIGLRTNSVGSNDGGGGSKEWSAEYPLGGFTNPHIMEEMPELLRSIGQAKKVVVRLECQPALIIELPSASKIRFWEFYNLVNDRSSARQ